MGEEANKPGAAEVAGTAAVTEQKPAAKQKAKSATGSEKKSVAKAASDGKTASSSGKKTGKSEQKSKQRDAARAPTAQTQQWNVRGTVIRKLLRVGDHQLAGLVEKQWPQVHHSLYYITVFAPMAIPGKVVKAANKGMRAYVTEKISDATRMLEEAGDKAEDNGISVGAPGFLHENVVEIASQVETDVLQLVRALDDYVVMMDSLWIGNCITDDERVAAHKEAKDTLMTVHKLAIRMRTRLIDYRHKKMKNIMNKQDDEVCRELEGLVLTLTGISVAEKPVLEERAVVPAPRAPNKPRLEASPVAGQVSGTEAAAAVEVEAAAA